jgi:hypothetical protein
LDAADDRDFRIQLITSVTGLPRVSCDDAEKPLVKLFISQIFARDEIAARELLTGTPAEADFPPSPA